jgi:hypothetical protein
MSENQKTVSVIRKSGQFDKNNDVFTKEALRKAAEDDPRFFIRETDDGEVELCLYVHAASADQPKKRKYGGWPRMRGRPRAPRLREED